MTTEQPTAPATPPAGFDTFAEMTKLRDAGVPEAHAVAMLYAGIAAADARFAELLRELQEREERLLREIESAKKDVTLRLGAWVLAVATLSVTAVGIIVHWPA